MYICAKQLKNRNNMRQFNNYEAVKINNAEEAMEFLQYLEDNTDLRWFLGMKPTDISKRELNIRGFPVFIEVYEDYMSIVKFENNLEDETKVIPLTEFLKPKVTYTREQAEKMFKDYVLFHNNAWSLYSRDVVSFLDHKFPKSTLEQVTEAVKDLGNFTIEQTSTGEIIISPINK